MVFNGIKEKIVVLDKLDLGIYNPKMVWEEMYDFSIDSVLLVLSDCLYYPMEYIKDRIVLCELVKKLGGGNLLALLVLFVMRREYGS